MSVVLSEHLPLLATAPDGMQKLRGLILELAVRGKLVPQDPNDEPASELLKRIAKERALQEAEGACKKSKATPPVGEDEQPFALPLSWAWTRLGEITNFGQTEKDGEICDTTWVLDLEDIQKDTSVLLRKVRFAERQAKSDKNRFQEGDVLYGKLRPYLNKVIVADEEGVCTTEILPVRGYYGIFPRFLMHAVKRPDFLAYVNSKSYGMKMPRLGTDDGRLALFPLPPANEQHRIVAKVDELMALCDRLEAEQADAGAAHARLVETLLGTLTQSADTADLAANWQRLAEHFDTVFTTEASLDALKQTILQLAVMGKLVPQDPNDEPASELLKRIAAHKSWLAEEGKYRGSYTATAISNEHAPSSVPFNWVWAPFGDIMISRDSERIPVSKDERNTRPKLYDYYGASGVIDKIDHYLFEKPLLLIGEDGANLINRSTPIAFIARGKYWVNNHAHVLDGISEGFLRFIELQINAIDLKPYVTGTAQPKMNQAKMNSIPVALPPEAEQHRIVAKVDELMALVARLKADLAESRVQQERLAATLIESALKAA